jgi:hypothetical protein
MLRVMNVDKNPAYPAAVEALNTEAVIPNHVVSPQCKHFNCVIERDHRMVKKRVWPAKGYGTFQSAWRTLEGSETVNMIRGPSEMTGQRRCGRPGALHRRTVRTLCLIDIHAQPTSPYRSRPFPEPHDDP